jgi:hypothetical protein
VDWGVSAREAYSYDAEPPLCRPHLLYSDSAVLGLASGVACLPAFLICRGAEDLRAVSMHVTVIKLTLPIGLHVGAVTDWTRSEREWGIMEGKRMRRLRMRPIGVGGAYVWDYCRGGVWLLRCLA